MANEQKKDHADSPQNRHPYRYFWLTGGLAAILAIGASVLHTSTGSTSKSGSQPAQAPGPTQPAGSTGSPGQETSSKLSLTNLLGTWENNNPAIHYTARFILSNNGRSLIVHGFGACVPTPCNWGSVQGVAYAADGFTGAAAFTATYNFGFSDDIVAGYLSGGTLTVGQWIEYTDNSGRSNHYIIETFTKDAGSRAPSFALQAATMSLPGRWENTDSATSRTVRFILSNNGRSLIVHGFGACVPTPCDWGTVQGVAYAADGSTGAAAFTATYNFGFSDDIVAGYLSGGTLTVGQWIEYTDNSGPNLFDIETFSRVG